jgi:hypothetical protein
MNMWPTYNQIDLRPVSQNGSHSSVNDQVYNSFQKISILPSDPKVPDRWQSDSLSDPMSEVGGQPLKLPDAFLILL